MERHQTEAEKKWLQDLLAKLPTSGRRTKEAAENFLVLLAFITLAGVLAWSGIAWLTMKISDFDIGWSSQYAIPVVLALLAIFAAYAAYSTMQWMRSWPDSRQPVRDDLRAGIVTEERLTIVEAKLLQEPEHGGLIYFLKSDDGRIYVQYDRESIELAMTDEDPTGSSFEPQGLVTIVKAPQSQFTIDVSFDGESIDIYGPIEMTAPPGKWPGNQVFCSIPWNEIENELCPRGS